MRVSSPRRKPSPIWDDHVRMKARVRYERGGPEEESLWFDIPGEFRDGLAPSGTPWLACLAPLAFALGERLELEAPVDPWLLRNVRELMYIWSAWYPGVERVPIHAEPEEPAGPGTKDGHVAAFFSGGVDSLFTLVTHNGPDPDKRPHPEIDDLVTIWGLDIPISRPGEFSRGIEQLAPVAQRYDVGFVQVATNLFETRWRAETDWGHLSHGSALASTALLLGDRYEAALVPSTLPYGSLSPWGSHPMTDPLHSTSDTMIVHDGAGFSRLDKSERIVARDPDLLDVIRVCWESKEWRNCGRCEKCYRTMAILEILEVREACSKFRGDDFRVPDLAKIYAPDAPTPIERHALENIRAAALSRGRPDIAHFIRRSLTWSRLVDRCLGLADWLDQRRGMWRLSGPLRRFCLGRSIT